MVKIKDVYDYIDSFAPFDSQMDFDNSGLLVGSPETEIKKIGVVLDITKQAVEWAVDNGVDLIVAHHPVIFSPLKSVDESYPVYHLIKNGISAVCAHTNLDCAEGGVGDCLADALGGKVVGCIPDTEYPDSLIGRLVEFDKEFTPDEFESYVNRKLNTTVRICKGKENIKRAVLGGGACSELIMTVKENNAQALVTGEVKHHHFLYAKDEGLTDVEAGHFETENVVVEPLAKKLCKQFQQIEVVTIPQNSPTK